jgi:uncharacterized RDD family membrane protein YckC
MNVKKLNTNVSIKKRIMCMLYEGILIFGIIFATSLIYAVIFNQKHALHQRFGLQLCIFLVLGLYFIHCWQRSGQTLAMKTWNIKLSPISLTTAMLRYILCYILWIMPAVILAYIINAPKYDLYIIGVNILLLPLSSSKYLLNNLECQSLHDRILKIKLQMLKINQ